MKFHLLLILFLTLTSMNSQDWAQLDRYKQANATLAPPKPNEHRVVFMGNSITEGWQQPELSFFNQKGYVNRGIGGQTTAQMKIRFWQDVIKLQPRIVVILGGINDIAQNHGFVSISEMAHNIEDMVNLAKNQGIEVVLCSVLPTNIFPWRMRIQPANQVIELNKLLKAIANNNHCYYLDYYSKMVNDEKGMQDVFTYDGVHCTLAGYLEMERIASKLLDRL
jgi:lysophospholipase L1-like esterase